MKTLKQHLKDKNLGNIYQLESRIIEEATEAVKEWLQKHEIYYRESLSKERLEEAFYLKRELIEELEQC